MKIKFLLIYLFATSLAIFQSYAQAPTKVWDKTFGGSATQNAQSIIASSDGGYFVVGLSSSNTSGDKSEDSQGGEDYWIVKIGRDGYKDWDRTIGGSGDDFARSVVATSGGGCIVAGTSSSDISGDKSEDSYGLDDYWIVRLDGDGEVEWDKTIGGNQADKLNSIITLYDGNFAIVGYSKSGISGNKSQASQGFEDYWIIKINISGQILWDKTFGGDSYDYATNISTNYDNALVVVGYSYSGISGNKTEVSRGQYDYWVIKLDVSGNLLWNKTIGGNDFDFATCVAQAYDGGYVIAGFSSSGPGGDKSQPSFGGDDYWVVKLSNSGALVWNRTIGGALNDYAFSVDATYYGEYIIGGSSSSGISGSKTEVSKGGSDYWILRLNDAGFPEWDKTIGGSGNDYFTKLQLIDDYTYRLAGTSNSPISGDKTEANKGLNDYWVVELEACSVISGPSYSNQTICYNTSTSIPATCNSGTPTWYDNSGTVFLYSGSPLITPILTTNTSYKVRCETGGIPNCMSTLSTAGIIVRPFVNNASVSPQMIVQNTSTTLVAGCTSSTPNWYSSSSGGTPLGTGNYTTPILTTNTTYYVSCETGLIPNCVSSIRTPQTVTMICPNSLTPTGTVTTNKKAATTVISTGINIIPNAANVTYQAGNYVQLNAGFRANMGSVFIAKILGGCL